MTVTRRVPKQTGYTIVEVVVTLFVIGLMTAFFGYIGTGALVDARAQTMINQMLSIAADAERYTRSVASSSVAASGRYTYVYNSIPPDSPVSALNAATGDGQPLASPFGLAYSITANRAVAFVQVTVPAFVINRGFAPGIGALSPGPGGSQIYTVGAPDYGKQIYFRRGRAVKRFLYEEN